MRDRYLFLWLGFLGGYSTNLLCFWFVKKQIQLEFDISNLLQITCTILVAYFIAIKIDKRREFQNDLFGTHKRKCDNIQKGVSRIRDIVNSQKIPVSICSSEAKKMNILYAELLGSVLSYHPTLDDKLFGLKNEFLKLKDALMTELFDSKTSSSVQTMSDGKVTLNSLNKIHSILDDIDANVENIHDIIVLSKHNN